MLEVGAIPTLCRNCKPPLGASQIQLLANIPEQEVVACSREQHCTPTRWGYMSPEQTISREFAPQPQLLLVSDVFPEIARTAETRTAQFLGGVAVRGELGVQQTPETTHSTTLMAATQEGAMG